MKIHFIMNFSNLNSNEINFLWHISFFNKFAKLDMNRNLNKID